MIKEKFPCDQYDFLTSLKSRADPPPERDLGAFDHPMKNLPDLLHFNIKQLIALIAGN